MEVGLGEVVYAIDAVDHHDEETNCEDQDCVKDEFVEIADCEKINDEEFEGDVKYLNISIDIHLLVSYNCCIVRHLGNIEPFLTFFFPLTQTIKPYWFVRIIITP